MALLQKRNEKCNALLKATLVLVNNGGIQGASMAKVAKVGNVSSASIYLYFESKQDMVNQFYLAPNPLLRKQRLKIMIPKKS